LAIVKLGSSWEMYPGSDDAPTKLQRLAAEQGSQNTATDHVGFES
jgi:hypothetical protein